MADKPNILFIFTDQQSHCAMSCTGNRYVNTPYMDLLANGGVRFEKCYCSAPVCTPARGSLVTGRLPHELGINWNDMRPDPKYPNMGHVFREAGYHTAWCGKWHLPHSYPRHKNDPDIPGFVNDPLPDELEKVGLGTETDEIVAWKAHKFLHWDAAKTGKPWVLGVSLHNPHDICSFTRLEPVQHTNIDSYPPLPDNFEPSPDEPAFLGMCRQRTRYGPEIQNTKDWDEHQWRAYLHAYYQMTEEVDKAIGRVLQGLDEGGWADNTLIVFTSDHGEGMAAHRWVVKLMFWEAVTRVPLIVHFPGAVAEGVVDSSHLASGLDVLPTICDYADVECPSVHGVSLKPYIDNPGTPGREYVACELATNPHEPDMKGRMVRTQRHKYCVFSKGERPELLFDLDEDPGETRNLAAEAPMMDIVAHHRALLAEWMKRTNDDFVMPSSVN